MRFYGRITFTKKVLASEHICCRRNTCLIATFVTAPVPALAAPGAIRYVAATGTVGNGTSCASPGFVGATGTAIQAAIDAANSGDAIRICAGTYSISTRL